jgi:hypothetical protein
MIRPASYGSKTPLIAPRITREFPALDAVTSSASVAGNLSAALHTLQQIPGQLSAQAKAAAEARLQQLIETYRKLALVGDPQTLAFLAKQIGIAARALGESAATASLPSSSPGDEKDAAPAPDDPTAKTILVQAGSVVETIRRRLAFAAVALRHPQSAKRDLATVNNAARAVADALNAVGGPFNTPVGGSALNLVA